MAEFKDIPMPENYAPKKGKYNWGEMPVGKCQEFDLGEFQPAMSSASQWKRRHAGWNFIARKTPKSGRIWRTA